MPKPRTKKKDSLNLGRSIVKDRFKGYSKGNKDPDSFVHTSEIHDGYDWGRLNLQSVTEQSNLDEFLATAELAGTEFTAERLNIKFVSSEDTGLLDKGTAEAVKDAQKKHKDLLRIPRRPPWDQNTTADELNQKERESFLEWRRGLAELQEREHIILTPFEKNLEFWRQLWRVIERSDIIVQIVDARNPLLFRCEDLEKYVHEVDETKMNMVLVNKADLLSQKQRQYWADYFDSIGVRVIFWSAKLETELQDKNDKEHDSDDEEFHSDIEEEESAGSSSEGGEEEMDETTCRAGVEDRVSNLNIDSEKSDEKLTGNKNGAHLVNGLELVEQFKVLHKGKKYTEGVTTIGLVGYPNVGKSSTINALLQSKKVPVSATPGRTKHFQTLYLEPTVLLCDCPGLVMPTFVSTAAEMVINGILPIDQMRDYVPPSSVVCSLIPRHILELYYGIMIKKPKEGEDPDRIPTAHELLNAYGYMRGFMTSKGVPDCPRSSRIILKDFVNGDLLYAHPPPGVDPVDYDCTPMPSKPSIERRIEKREIRQANEKNQKNVLNSEIDGAFFTKMESRIGSKGVQGTKDFTRVEGLKQYSFGSNPSSVNTSSQSLDAKPWRKHGNRKKKEKLRRIHAHLDQHTM